MNIISVDEMKLKSRFLIANDMFNEWIFKTHNSSVMPSSDTASVYSFIIIMPWIYLAN